ncbi:MAG: hypothetical protein CMO20_01090, partial [Thermoplasmata archaeon]|nr:hypothetical protein [Thermoplasmata archaeon]
MKSGKCWFLVALMMLAIIPLMEVEGGNTKSPIRVRESLTEFSWEPNIGENQPNTVSVIGEWDWGNTTNLFLDNNTGKWTTSISLDEGLYCYKFVIDGNDYRFDNYNTYRGYCGQHENSIVRVENTSKPAISLESYNINSDELDATILYWAGSNQANPNTINATLIHDFSESPITGTWDSNNWEFNVEINNLSDGKYTLRVNANDENNANADELILPFWIGEQANFIWDDALIYMIMTDRFVDGNSSNNPATTNAAHGADWQGGDFEGVTQMIQSGYFNNLGVNALWLTPFNTAANGTGVAGDGQHQVSAYHGYWPTEPRSVDSRLGTEADLEDLISAAHEHGIRVMGDFVVNHVHEDHPYYSNNPDWFNQGCLCGTQNCDWTEHRLDCQFRTYMPDINWKNRNASEQMMADGLWWLERFDLDGARIDAVKHVDDLAIFNFATQVKERFETMGTDYYLKGETAMGWAGHNLVDNQDEYGMINRYMGENGLDGQADFVLYHAVVDNVFTSGNMDYQHLDYWTARSQDQYAIDSTMVPFIGSHDVPRFTSRADSGTNDEWNQWQEDGLPGQPGGDYPYQAALQAYTWLLSTPGAPLIYQGDEYGEFGGADPDNRHMWRNNSNINNRELSLMENVSDIAQLRLESEALRRGAYASLHNDTDTIAWSMTTTTDQAIIAMNRGITSAQFDLDLKWVANDSLNGVVMDEEHRFTLPAHSVGVFLFPHSEISGACVLGELSDDSPLNVDASHGNDSYIGSSACPIKNIQNAVDRLEDGGKVIVHSGNYQESVTFSDLNQIEIKTDGSRVILDGSADVQSDLGGIWQNFSVVDEGTIHSIDVGVDAWQLFVDREEMIPARWPNAQFTDGSVFNITHNWAEGTMERDKFKDANNSWVYPYVNGEIIDAGPVDGGHVGLNASGIDPVGAIAVLNVGSFKSWSRVITEYNQSNAMMHYEPVESWKTKHHRYFLEGKLELLDVPGEWFFDRENTTIYFMTPNGQNPNDMNIRVKTQPYSMSCLDSNEVVIEGFEFFASTFKFDNCDDSIIRNATLLYPSTSKRSLGIAGEDSSERWISRFDRTSGSSIENSAFLYTDGGAFELYGGENTVDNCYFYHIDWTSTDSVSLMTTVYFGGSDNVFSNNTIHNTGASSVINPGNAATVEYNDISNTGHLQTDGAVVQLMMGQQTDAMIAYNWIHDTPKYGIRMDGPMGGTNEGRNATIHHNVAWNIAGGIMVKGDYHNISHNTVFGVEPGSPSNEKNNIIVIGDGGNENSTFFANAADRISSHRQDNYSNYPVPGNYSANFNGYLDSGGSVESQLTDTLNHNFCPVPGSAIATIGAGAYSPDCSNPWTAGTDWDFQHPTIPLEGCTNSLANNFNSSALVDDGSCNYEEVEEPEPEPEPEPIEGCTNSSATNYDPLAEVDDGSCQFPQPEPIEGCTNSNATNYDPLAEVDDGSCTYNNPVNNNTNQTTNQSSNETSNNTQNQTGNQTNPEESPQNENNTESNPDSEKIIEENNQDSTTETGGFE